jgi:rhodanese-related sulfurtransferase
MSIAVVAALVLLAAVGALLVRRQRRNRYRITPSEVMRLIETSPDSPPVILDVRDGAAYAKSPVTIQGARHLSPEALEAGGRALDVDAHRTVVAYCS